MVETIERDSNDLFAYKWGERFFKNPKTLFVLRSVALGVFVYALAYGFVHPEASENHFTTAFFWPFFMFLFLLTLGAYFCSVCPLAFVGKKIIERKGRDFNMPKALKNPYISLGIVLGGYWGLFLCFSHCLCQTDRGGVLLHLFHAAGVYLLLSLQRYELLCSHLSHQRDLQCFFTYLVHVAWSYRFACDTCTTFECAKACEFDQSPFNFDRNNSMGDCTLCMDCANACPPLAYKSKGFGFSLSRPIGRAREVDVWTYLLLFAFMTLTTQFNHSDLAPYLPWMWLSNWLKGIFPHSSLNFEAVLTLMVSLVFTLYVVYIGFKIR